MSECWVALACQRDAPSEHAVALSALVHALKQENKAAGETQLQPRQAASRLQGSFTNLG
jgi:hypothetical protein